MFVPVNDSSWGTPLVPIVKPDGNIRLCADYKVTVNKAMRPGSYQLPMPSHLLPKLSGAKFFAKLDLSQAYLQLPVTEEAARVQAVVTNQGCFKVTRLQFGINLAPEIFQAAMDKIFCNMEGIIVYFDDLLLFGSSMNELSERIHAVLTKLRKNGLKLKREKCKFGLTEIEFLGYSISEKGIKPCENLSQAIRDAPEPNDKHELRAFLGLLNFYHSFLPHKATILDPLHNLLKKDVRWKWTKECTNSFNNAKKLLSNHLLLTLFNPKFPIVLVCDASPVGVGSVLCHKINGKEIPIAFHSRTLTKTERNYAQIDREALAIIDGVKKFHNFIYGFPFEIVTDHKPLLGLFNPSTSTPDVISPRMLRWNYLLSAYSYKITHRPGLQIPHAAQWGKIKNL